jgi:hypothetical protein
MKKLTNSPKMSALRSIALLVAVAVLGWLSAKYLLPEAVDVSGVPAGALERPAGASAIEAAGPAEPANPGRARDPDAQATQAPAGAPGNRLDELLRKQNEISLKADQAASSPKGTEAVGAKAAGAAPPAEDSSASAGADAQTQRQRALMALQTEALAQIQAVRPGDTQGLIKAMESFDAKMQQAGAPALLDLDGVRKTLLAADRIQQLNAALVAEASKGREVDPQKIKSISAQLNEAHKSLSNPIVKPEVLKDLMRP